MSWGSITFGRPERNSQSQGPVLTLRRTPVSKQTGTLTAINNEGCPLILNVDLGRLQGSGGEILGVLTE